MRVKIYDQQAKEVGTTELPSDVFEVEINPDLLQQAVVTQEANARVSIAHAKGRGEVSGGGKKPWKQKGTGRARHGSIRSPIWRHGGVSHGPTKYKIYAKKINKKARRKALLMALSSKVHDKELFVVDALKSSGKTKEIRQVLVNFGKLFPNVKRPTFLVVTAAKDDNLIHAVKNLSFAAPIGVKSLNVRDILRYKFMILPKEAISIIAAIYSLKTQKAARE